jgi:PIN domain nuclease of toxin-antitoxin system
VARPVNSYLDTHTAIWLANSDLEKISRRALDHIAECALLISPMVVLEFQYLFEVKKLMLPPHDLQRKLEHELGVRVCNFGFPSIAAAAIHENWTREPFDRLIVAHAKANGFAPLISADRMIRQHYQRAIW